MHCPKVKISDPPTVGIVGANDNAPAESQSAEWSHATPSLLRVSRALARLIEEDQYLTVLNDVRG